ncbi:MAG: IS200/IS605 family transposase [Rickettsiales bacterium]|jgi:putative transposase|nr:IS200/IS605 family transposase [Rickettsiales bacterium]
MVEIVKNGNCISPQLTILFGVLIILCHKYRKNILTGHAAEKSREFLETVGLKHGFSIIAKEVQLGDIHLFVSIPPSISFSELLKKVKGISARTFLVI